MDKLLTKRPLSAFEGRCDTCYIEAIGLRPTTTPAPAATPDAAVVPAAELRRLVRLTPDVVDAIEDGLRQLGAGRVITPTPLRMDIPSQHGEVDVKTAHVEGWDSFGIKASTGFFDNPARGMETSGGFMALLDAGTGRVIAVLLDGGYLTTVRTAAAGAVAARWLAPKDVRTLGIVGTGEQALWQARAVALVRSPERVLVFGRRPERAAELSRRLSEELGVRAEPAATVEELVTASEAVVTCTPAREPLVRGEWLHPGLHITAVGSDSPDKQELEADVLLWADRVVCDLRRQCLEIGEGRAAARTGAFPAPDKPVELGSVVSGDVQGRRSEREITVCDLTGVGVTDTAVARLAWRQAKAAGLVGAEL